MANKLSPREKAALATQMMNRVSPPSPAAATPTAGPARQINSVQIGLAMAGQGSKVSELEKQLHETEKTVDAMRAELVAVNAEWHGVLPAKKLDPHAIRPSKWANRHERSFEGQEFLDLKAEIVSAGGNVQAIKVRPVPGSQPQEYEIVFGHRRHRACLESGLPVLATIESIDDKALFKEMDRENRLRSDLRPYEQGLMYKRALDEGMFGSLRKLSEELGVDVGNASRAVQLAKLPEAVLNAFGSRLDIQYRWASVLSDLVSKEGDALLARAQAIAADLASGKQVSPAESFNRLMAKADKPAPTRPRVVKLGKNSLKISETPRSVTYEVSRVPKEKLSKIEKLIAEVLAE